MSGFIEFFKTEDLWCKLKSSMKKSINTVLNYFFIWTFIRRQKSLLMPSIYSTNYSSQQIISLYENSLLKLPSISQMIKGLPPGKEMQMPPSFDVLPTFFLLLHFFFFFCSLISCLNKYKQTTTTATAATKLKNTQKTTWIHYNEKWKEKEEKRG